MDKIVLAAASFEKQQYFLEEQFASLPDHIREDVRVICITLAQKLGCTFLIGFYEDGEVYFETVVSEDRAIDFDEIGAELEIKELTRNQKELLHALKIWYTVFFTEEGAQLKASLLKNEQDGKNIV